MSTTQAVTPVNDDEEIELEPTVVHRSASGETPERIAGLGVAEGSMGSLGGTMESLRRSRLCSAALVLAAIYGVFLVRLLLELDTDHRWGVVVILTRLGLAAIVAGVLMSKLMLSEGQLRATEYILFGGLTASLCLAQYFMNIDRARHGELITAVVAIKNGILQLFIFMVLYGMFIPNKPRITAEVVLSMALAFIVVLVLLAEHSEGSKAVNLMWATEHSGTNILLILVGAGFSIYGAFVLNALRTELHEARKFGQYQLRDKIGEGGMGEVYLAEHQLLKRPCALKLIRADGNASPIAVARFEREVQSAARLFHPNTIEIYDYGHTNDGTFYYVMEYLEGLSLGELVNEFGPLPAGRVIYLLRQACGGLAEAHALGLVHRDLKPANLYVAHRGGEFDVVKVLDFGLVKLTRDPQAPQLTTDQTVSGTPMFMSPEQAVGDPELDARSDIYALGALGYFALTGRPPFTGDNPMAIMIAHARDPVLPPSQFRPEVPADLEAIIVRCLAKKPEERFPDVKSLARALAACAAAGDWNGERAEQWWTNPVAAPVPA
jgi:serine/threonine-protein kinase